MTGPETTLRHFLGWCEERKFPLIHILPEQPRRNGRAESFNADQVIRSIKLRNGRLKQGFKGR
jgi:transposase InsO family protein